MTRLSAINTDLYISPKRKEGLHMYFYNKAKWEDELEQEVGIGPDSRHDVTPSLFLFYLVLQNYKMYVVCYHNKHYTLSYHTYRITSKLNQS